MRVLVAIGISVFVHLILAAGLWWYFTSAPVPVVLAQLDLSSVELSFAEEDVSTAVPVASLPASAAPTAARPEPETSRPPTPESLDPTLPSLAEPLSPEVRAAVPELPEVRKQVRPEFSKKEPGEHVRQAAPESSAAPAVAPQQARVDAPPSLKRAIRPDYPRGARLRKEEGDVVLEIHVAASGEVRDVRVVDGSGFAELDEAAVRAVKAARFTPARSGRDDVASVARLKLSFRLK